MKVTIGPDAAQRTWQDTFSISTKCCRCGGVSDLAFTAHELDIEDKSPQVCGLHPNEPGGRGYWLHNACAVAVYFCQDCLEPTAHYNQA